MEWERGVVVGGERPFELWPVLECQLKNEKPIFDWLLGCVYRTSLRIAARCCRLSGAFIALDRSYQINEITSLSSLFFSSFFILFSCPELILFRVWCVSFTPTTTWLWMPAKRARALRWCSDDKLATSIAFEISVYDPEVDRHYNKKNNSTRTGVADDDWM